MAIVSLGYRTDLTLLGLQGSVIEQRPGYQVIRTPANPTFHWGNFLLLDRPPAAGMVSSWTSAFAREFPAAEHLAIGVDGTSGDAGDEAELAAGLEADRSAVLTAAATTPAPHPNGVAQFRILESGPDWELPWTCRNPCIPTVSQRAGKGSTGSGCWRCARCKRRALARGSGRSSPGGWSPGLACLATAAGSPGSRTWTPTQSIATKA